MIDNDKKIFLDIDRKFIREWIERASAEENKDSELTQFFCYFIAFNYLYSSLWYQNNRIAERSFSGPGERKMIKELIDYCYSNTSYRFDSPYKLLSDNSELRKYVSSMNSRRSEDYSKYCKEKRDYQKKIDEEDINELFQNIYTVRCNLFHGSKSMLIYRDSQLVKESNKVLSEFLKNDYFR